MMRKLDLKNLLDNNRVIFVVSLLLALIIWLIVVINVSPEETRVIQNVKVVIDESVPSQFGLEVFGEREFFVDVTVKGKRYLISPGALSPEDIVVTAQTSNVDSAGKRNLQLKAESASNSSDYSIYSISEKSIDVYFDTAKTVQFVIEPHVVTGDFPIVEEGFTSGAINLSKTAVTISGPSTEVNRIEKVVAKLELKKSLSSNKSADASVIPLDDSGKSNFKYLTQNIESVVLTIPVLRVKELETVVTFKNAPDSYVGNVLKYSISPRTELFNISVDDYESIKEYSIGTIDFKNLSPNNRVFTFSSEDIDVAEESEAESFTVTVNMSGISQDYITFPAEKIKLNNPAEEPYNVSGLNKSVVVVGTPKALESVTDDDISVEVDLSEVDIRAGQSVTVPAVVSVRSDDCWVYGIYYVDVSL